MIIMIILIFDLDYNFFNQQGGYYICLHQLYILTVELHQLSTDLSRVRVGVGFSQIDVTFQLFYNISDISNVL